MRPDVRGYGCERGVYDCGACSPRDAVVVCFADAAEGGDVGFYEVVLCEIWEVLEYDSGVGVRIRNCAYH